MQLWLCCALLVFVAGGCLAQKPRPCKSPPLFEGSFSVVAQNGDFLGLGKQSYDAILKRIRIREFVMAGNHTEVIDALLLYQEKLMYQIDYKHRTCQKQALIDEFHPMEIPANSTLLGQVVLGSLSAPGEGVLANSWTGDLPEVKGWYAMTFTEFGCFPVGLLYSVPKTDLIVGSFFNNIRGIEDPSVFIPPPFCDDATLKAGEGNFFSVFF
ncbi:ependymin-like isoform 2-T2 [Clarias gariepinus]|uniref:ependymin-like isoform X2 n=1 Tax=Clarias gariepinus TaxID=13013 RepID=UPI00234D127E|nr:ependymin-like isoform X2 [Clarias gariepinus]